VIHGDTFVCQFFDGKEEHFRLIGVDTPESRRNQKGEKDSQRRVQDIEPINYSGKESI
jgi:endonuclease YncB( thermonuclease family)